MLELHYQNHLTVYKNRYIYSVMEMHGMMEYLSSSSISTNKKYWNKSLKISGLGIAPHKIEPLPNIFNNGTSSNQTAPQGSNN